ncbi:MAG TPA: hypothetical protein VK471_12675 [Solirubrobacterales bacterium]|nr:hypothetical protein [Solirubrobacterales bacterium]
MESHELDADFPAAVHLHETTVLDRETGLGLSITAVPADAIPDQPLEAIGRFGGLDFVGEFAPTEPALLAALAAMLEGEGEEGALEMERLLGADPNNPLANVDPWRKRFIEHCAFTPILAVEESPIRPKVLVAMLGGAAAITVAAIPAAGLVLAIVGGVGTVVLVAAVGPAAVALGERLEKLVAG